MKELSNLLTQYQKAVYTHKMHRYHMLCSQFTIKKLHFSPEMAFPFLVPN